MADVSLNSIVIPASSSIRRDPPCPQEALTAKYRDDFDSTTIFYDTYRCGRFVVLQGPPLLNLRAMLDASPNFTNLVKSGVFLSRPHGDEIWVRSQFQEIDLETEVGPLKILTEPDLNHLFAGKRVLVTLSKDNELLWIKDWIKYYVNLHGADGILIYDNSSTKYSVDDLRSYIAAEFPAVTVIVVAWAFRYGRSNPKTDWDPVFCQSGALQHARFRFLQKAKSVLNCDIDELVVSEDHKASVFEVAERSFFGVVYFRGRWIYDHRSSRDGLPRHGDLYCYDSNRADFICPPKWAVVPRRCPLKATWRPHTIQGVNRFFSHKKTLSYRHFKSLSTNWKYNRSESIISGAAIEDELLKSCLQEGKLR